MWADNETTRDLLGFRVHADLIRSLVTNPNMLPLTVGVFGDWGSGKTSVMHMLRDDLNPERYPEDSKEHAAYKNIVCLYFNGWLFEGYDDAKSALLSAILLQLKDHQKIKGKLDNKVMSLLKSVNWMRLARFGFKEVAIPAALAYFSGGATLIPTLVDKFKSAVSSNTSVSTDKTVLDQLIDPHVESSDPTDVRTFRERFGELLKESNIESLVILIDDLDRCSPQRIIDNLEAIKLFLSVERTAFVIGADRRIVRHAIATVYKSEEIQQSADKSDQVTDLVEDYLEKLIQVPYRLPRLSPTEVESYMSLLFCQRHLETDVLEKIHKASAAHYQEDRYRVFGHGAIEAAIGGIPTEVLSQSLHFCTSSAPLITEGLKGNPRQIKRFLNAYILRKQLAEAAKLTNIRDDVLVKLMVLEYAHLDCFNQLYTWQASQDGYPNEIEKLEATLDSEEGTALYEEIAKGVGALWNTTSLRKWIEMSPRLSPVDLRDYFWLARDRLQSTLSTLSLISPGLRRVFEDLISGETGRYLAAIDFLKKAQGDEVTQVYQQLVQQIQRFPGQREAFDGIFEMIEQDVPSAADVLYDGLMKCQPDRLAPAVGVTLITMVEQHPELNDKFAPVLERLRSSKSSIAGALSKRVGK